MIESSSSDTSVRRSKRNRGSVSEHYDTLLRRFQTNGNGSNGKAPRTIGVTSCHEREGVTTVAVNFAVAAANKSTAPVLLVDANTRKPSLHKVFRVRANSGLIDGALGHVGISDCVVDSPIHNLSLLLSGNEPTNGQGPVFDGTAFEEILDNIKHEFPLAVFDLPPAVDLTSCFELAGRLDGVLLVIEADRVDRTIAKRAIRQLRQANAKILGVVLSQHRFGED